jgi:hypothetical protein
MFIEIFLITELLIFFFHFFIKHWIEKGILYAGINPKEHPYKYNVFE